MNPPEYSAHSDPPLPASPAPHIQIVTEAAEAMMCCCSAKTGLIIIPCVMIVLNLISVFLWDADVRFTIYLIVCNVYILYCINEGTVKSLKYAQIVAAKVAFVTIVYDIVDTVIIDYDYWARLYNALNPQVTVTADELRRQVWTYTIIDIVIQASIASIMIGYTERYKKWVESTNAIMSPI